MSSLRSIGSVWTERWTSFRLQRVCRFGGSSFSCRRKAKDGSSRHESDRGLIVVEQRSQVLDLVAMAAGSQSLSRGRTNDPILVG